MIVQFSPSLQMFLTTAAASRWGARRGGGAAPPPPSPRNPCLYRTTQLSLVSTHYHLDGTGRGASRSREQQKERWGGGRNVFLPKRLDRASQTDHVGKHRILFRYEFNCSSVLCSVTHQAGSSVLLSVAHRAGSSVSCSLWTRPCNLSVYIRSPPLTSMLESNKLWHLRRKELTSQWTCVVLAPPPDHSSRPARSPVHSVDREGSSGWATSRTSGHSEGLSSPSPKRQFTFKIGLHTLPHSQQNVCLYILEITNVPLIFNTPSLKWNI